MCFDFIELLLLLENQNPYHDNYHDRDCYLKLCVLSGTTVIMNHDCWYYENLYSNTFDLPQLRWNTNLDIAVW